MKKETGKVFLYRHYDKYGQLLYIGISLNVVNRLISHKRYSEWFVDIANITMEKFPTRNEAIIAEQLAIARERPKHNIVHNREPKKSQEKYNGLALTDNDRYIINYCSKILQERNLEFTENNFSDIQNEFFPNLTVEEEYFPIYKFSGL